MKTDYDTLCAEIVADRASFLREAFLRCYADMERQNGDSDQAMEETVGFALDYAIEVYERTNGYIQEATERTATGLRGEAEQTAPVRF